MVVMKNVMQLLFLAKNKKMTNKITSEKEYQEAIAFIYTLMNKGENALSTNDTLQLSALAEAAEIYEDDNLSFCLKNNSNSFPN